MKYFFILIFTAFFSIVSFGQARTGTADYLKAIRPAVIADLSYPVKIVENVIEDNLKKMGYKGKSSKGFELYKGVSLPELGAGTYDLYFSVDKKSRRDKDNSIVTMLLSKGYENFVGENDDAALIAGAKKFLDGLHLSVSAFDLEQQIKEQEDLVRKNEKKEADLVEYGTDLESKIKKLQQQLQDNKKDVVDQAAEVEKQKQILEKLKERRKE